MVKPLSSREPSIAIQPFKPAFTQRPVSSIISAHTSLAVYGIGIFAHESPACLTLLDQCRRTSLPWPSLASCGNCCACIQQARSKKPPLHNHATPDHGDLQLWYGHTLPTSRPCPLVSLTFSSTPCWATSSGQNNSRSSDSDRSISLSSTGFLLGLARRLQMKRQLHVAYCLLKPLILSQ